MQISQILLKDLKQRFVKLSTLKIKFQSKFSKIYQIPFSKFTLKSINLSPKRIMQKSPVHLHTISSVL